MPAHQVLVCAVLVLAACAFVCSVQANERGKFERASEQATPQVTLELVSDLAQAAIPGFEGDQGGATRGVSSRTRDPAKALRITFETSLFDNDAASAVCDSVGASFVIGESSATDACSATLSTNCTSTCTSEMLFTQAKRDLLVNDVFPAVAALLAAKISVVNPASSVAFGLPTCPASVYGSVAVPANLVSSPVPDTDLVILVSRRPLLANARSYGVECSADQTGRPVTGLVNVAPQYLDPADVAGSIATIAHEVVHVMGFSSAAFRRFRSGNGQPYAAVVRQASTSFGNVVSRVVTPRVVGIARQFWDCAAATGVELENADSPSGALFWEKRQLGPELMTQLAPFPPPALSIFTLALLEDSSWYGVDYAAADNLRWGFRGGCTFFDGQCLNWPAGYFCSVDDSLGCTASRDGKGICEMERWFGIPLAYQYFGNDEDGGASILSDFCPFFIGTAASSCSNTAASPSAAGELFGASSLCFDSTLSNASASYTGLARPACYQALCNGTSAEGFRLQLVVEGQAAVDCPQSGGPVSVTGFFGAIICPAARSVCEVPSIVPPTLVGAASGLAGSPGVLGLLALVVVLALGC